MQLTLISIAISLASLAGCYAGGVTLWLAIPIGLLLHLPLVLGVFHPAGSWVCPTITCASCDSGMRVALTFDDGPCPDVTPRVLDILAQHCATATFFCVGRNVRRYPHVVRAIADAGHELGNHGFCHPHHIYLWSQSLLIRDMALTQRAIKRSAGVTPRVYRPAVGFRGFAMAGAIKQMGMQLVNFSARAYDTHRITPQRIVERILRRVKQGGIILLHDGSDPPSANPDRHAMLEALHAIIDSLRETGYRFVSMSELMGD